jgi:micrococcal nuclease
VRPAPLALALLLFAAACAPVAPTDGTPQSNAPPAQDEPTATAPPAVTGSPTPSALDQALVVRVVDGDTIDVLIGGEQLRVRYIGIDTPETVDPRRPVGCFGKEASARNRELVEGKTVGLEKDVSETDRFGRLLRYVWLDPSTGSGQALMVNARLVEEGYATVSTFPPDVRHAELFAALQAEARTQGRGLWGACATPEAPSPTTAAGACDQPRIKGNISLTTGEKIYHVPGGYYYDDTVIDETKGERWFCTEAEAVAAGWRKSKR